MTDNLCSRESVLNYLLDRHKTTISDLTKKVEHNDPSAIVELTNDCMGHFVESDIPFDERVSWVLDRICSFYNADASYWIEDPIKPPAMQVCSQRALASRRKPPEV